MKDTEAEHGMDSGTATEAVVCQVGVHQHQLANQCSLGEKFQDRDTWKQTGTLGQGQMDKSERHRNKRIWNV